MRSGNATTPTTATVLLAAYLTERMGLDRGLFTAAAIMVVTSFVAIGVGPRTVGRQNAYTIALFSALPLQAISVLLTPINFESLYAQQMAAQDGDATH